jgi:hypothetical protein
MVQHICSDTKGEDIWDEDKKREKEKRVIEIIIKIGRIQ